MELLCLPRLSKEQVQNLPDNYVFPCIEGTFVIDDEHPNGAIFIYVGYCNWDQEFEKCLKKFVLTVFHEIMHILLPQLENCVPYAEKISAETLDGH